MKSLYESIMQSRFPVHKIDESILNKSGVGKIYLIQKWLDEHGIKNYTINSKEEIDVDGQVVLTNNHLSEFPKYIQFNIVKRDFYCSYNELISLKGAPREVGGKFDCSYNNLTNINDSPEKVIGDFDCHHNKLKTLEGAPKEVGRDFDCSFNNLTTLEGAPEKVGKDFYCGSNKTKFNKEDVRKLCKVKKMIYV